MQIPSDERAARLHRIIVADVALAGTGGVAAVAMSLTAAQETELFWVGVFVIVTAAVIGSALRPLARGDINGAVFRVAASNWVVNVGVAVVATFAWPLLMQAALLPGVLAASFVSREQLRRYIAVSFAASMMVACLGLLQDVTGLSDRLPSWLRTTMLLAVGPALGALIVLVVLQHHMHLDRALTDERRARTKLADQADELRRSRLRVVAATDRERQRIERDLHDGAQSRLVAVNLGLARLKSTIASEPESVDESLAAIRHEVQLAHTELRDLAHGLYPTVLTQHGVAAAVSAATDRSAIPVRLDLTDVGRHHPDVEAAIYFCILEATQNASRHSRASTISVRLSRRHGEVCFEVSDDGTGFDPDATVGHGIVNMTDRMGAVGGTLDVMTNGGGGTVVVGTVPATGQ